jgi:hypothetical protein
VTFIKNVVFITSGQPSLNPRLVKEADALCEAGYQVTVIYQFWNKWGTLLDTELLKDKKWSAIKIGGDPDQQAFSYWKSRIKQRMAKAFSGLFGFQYNLAEIRLNRSALAQYRAAVKIKAQLYIAHNLGALAPALWAAKKNKCKCGFDAEDFHRFEVSDNPNDPDVCLKTYLEDKYMAELAYLTTASPLISEAYKRIYPEQHPKTILNVFPRQGINSVNDRERNTLKLFWFSQTIGERRGLESIIKAMGMLNHLDIELHLLGNCDEAVKAYFSKVASHAGIKQSKILYYPPIPADDIFSFASQFDVGLATEMSTPKNRDICLTNKIFTYVQSGLAIIASNTSAQKELMAEYPDMGFNYEQLDLGTLTSALAAYSADKALLITHKKNASLYAKEVLNWEQEKNKFLAIIKGL